VCSPGRCRFCSLMLARRVGIAGVVSRRRDLVVEFDDEARPQRALFAMVTAQPSHRSAAKSPVSAAPGLPGAQGLKRRLPNGPGHGLSIRSRGHRECLYVVNELIRDALHRYARHLRLVLVQTDRRRCGRSPDRRCPPTLPVKLAEGRLLRVAAALARLLQRREFLIRQCRQLEWHGTLSPRE
jgi:hypothetical protein